MEENIKSIFKNALENLLPFHKFLNVKLLEIDDGFAKMLFPFRPEYIGDPRTQRLHGGIIATAADSVGGAAAMTQMTSEKDKVATVDMRIDYLRPGQAKDIIAEGKIINKANRMIVTEMRIFHKESNEIIAIGKGVYNFRKDKDIS